MYILDMYSGPVALHYEIKLCYVMLCYVKANPRDFYLYINSQKKDTQGIFGVVPTKCFWSRCFVS